MTVRQLVANILLEGSAQIKQISGRLAKMNPPPDDSFSYTPCPGGVWSEQVKEFIDQLVSCGYAYSESGKGGYVLTPKGKDFCQKTIAEA